MNDDLTLSGEIYAGEYHLDFGLFYDQDWQIRITDLVTGRKETQTFSDEASMARVIRDFMNPEEPGEEFRKAFPFWC